MNTANFTLPQRLEQLRTGAIGAMILGLIVAVITLIYRREDFFQAYLYSFILWFGIPMGSLAFLMIHHMTGGAWTFVTQRILEASTRMLYWVMPVLFIPIALGVFTDAHNLYVSWTHNPDASHVIASKTKFYLNGPFWFLRAVAFFGLWFFIAKRFNEWSKELDSTGDGLIVLKFRKWAPLCLVLYCLSTTFAATDWLMSLEAEWFSTMYGPLFWISQGLTTLAFTIIILSFLAEQKPLSQFLTIEHYHHLGNMMMAFVVMWAYMSFSQYLITWSGNLPEEIHWYLARTTPGWVVLSLCLMAFHFFVPLMLLLFRRNKLNVSVLRNICYWILFWRLIDVFWVINPAFVTGQFPGIGPGDVVIHGAVFVGMGGVWIWFFLRELQKGTLLALNDPRLYEAVGHGSGEAVEHA